MFVTYMNKILTVPFGFKVLHWFRDLVTVSIAATIGTLPVTLYYFGQVSHYFLLTNIIVLPAAYIIVFAAIATLLFAHTVIGTWLAMGLKYLSGFTCSYVSWIEHLPHTTLQLSATLWMVICLVSAILFCYLSMLRKRLIWLAPAVASIALFCVLHIRNTAQTINQQSITIHGKTLYYNHGGTIEKHALTSRYTFFRFKGTNYVYAPHLSRRQQLDLEHYCKKQDIVLCSP